MCLPLSPSVLHGRITILFSSSKENNFEITISCFDKFCVGNSTLTFIPALELGCIHIQHCGIHSIWFPLPFSQTEGFQLIKDLIMTELQAQFSTQ